MSKYRRILLAITKGGMSQSEIADSLHVSKRDVSAAAKVARERGLTFEQVGSMDEGAVTDTFFRRGTRSQSLVPAARHGGPRREEEEEPEAPGQAPVAEHCDEAADRRKLSYSYQAFCEMFATEAERLGATRHFEHEPGAKCYVDWAGDPAWLTDMMTGAKAKIWLLVVVLPFSDRFWAEGFLDIRRESWQQGQAHAFGDFGGVPRVIVPDNWATATDRSAIYVTLLNKDRERFAEHYGAAVVPARVRKPRDKSTSESCVDLVEKWAIAHSNEMTFYTLEEFNEFCLKQVRWLDKRPFSAKDGSRDSVFEAEERPCL